MKRNLQPAALVLMIGATSIGLALSGCSKPENKTPTNASADSSTPAKNIPTQGVTDDEILIGGIHDLSGIFAAFSNPAINAANQYFDEVNANGGIHGRKIRYIIEDHGYQVPKAVQAANKLVNRDKVFVMMMNLGTPHNLAAFPIMDKNDVPNFAPLTYARAMSSEGPANRRYVAGVSYYDSMVAGINYLVKNKGASKLCAMYIPSDFGKESLEAVKTVSESNSNVNLVQESSHRPDETDFSGAMGKLKEAGCDTIALALGVRAAIGAVGTAKAMGWKDVNFIAPITGFHPAIASVPGGVTDGLYAITYWDYTKQQNDPVAKKWREDYKKKNGEEFTPAAVIGHVAARTLVAGLEAAGSDLTADSFNAGLETVNFVDESTGLSIKMDANDHSISEEVYLAQVKDGDWHTIAKIIN